MFSTAVLIPQGQSSIEIATLVARLLSAGIAALTAPAASGRSRPSALSARIARAARDSGPDMVVVGCSLDSLADTMRQASAAVGGAGVPVLVVPTTHSEPHDMVVRPPAGLLDHVVVLADYAHGAACAHACTARLAAQGATRATLQHVHGLRPSGGRPGRARKELEWIDFVNIEVLKDRLLRAGAGVVTFRMDETAPLALPPDTTVAILSGHCAAHMVESFSDGVVRAAAAGVRVPAILIPPGPCCGV